ncbi:Lsr2 family protein [Rhodococcus cerastii]|nr:Lsr2 family protein [Rhodococcus cerastii]
MAVSSRGSAGSGKTAARQIREWAIREGYEVSARGRISAEIEQAFHDAQARKIPVEKVPGGKAAAKKATSGKASAKKSPVKKVTARKAAASKPENWVALMDDPGKVFLLPGNSMPGHRLHGGDLDLNIGWEKFEKLTLRVSQELIRIEDVQVHRYGTQGQTQHGIDLAIEEPDGRYSVVQCKDYFGKSFTKSKFRKAVETFVAGELPFKASVYRFVVAVSSSVQRTEFEDERQALQKKYPKLKLRLWGSEAFNAVLRRREDIVAEFWTRETAEGFCTGVTQRGVPASPPDRVLQAEHLLGGPLETGDVAQLIHDAETAIDDTDPHKAAGFFACAAEVLHDKGFRSHAVSLRERQFNSLLSAELLEEAAALAGGIAAVSLHHADYDTADLLSRKLEELAGEDLVSRVTGKPRKGSDEVKRHVALIRAATEAAGSPIGGADLLRDALEDSSVKFLPEYQPLLVLLLGESMLVDRTDDLPKIDDLLKGAIAQSERLSIRGVEDLAIRLRLLVAEYNSEERDHLFWQAGNYKIADKRLSALVHAREARRRSLNPPAVAAKSLVRKVEKNWRDAVYVGVQAGLLEDAAWWLYSMRRLKLAYGLVAFGPDEEHRSAQSLRITPDQRLLPRYRNVRENALNEIVRKPAFAAMVATRRWLIDSVVSAHWAEEGQAWELLGDLYEKNSQLDRAADCYVRAGSAKKLTNLIEVAGDHLLPVGSLEGGPWWELRALCQILGGQVDLLDDKVASARLSELMELVRRGRAGKLLQDLQQSLSLEATKSVCALAGRGTVEQAKEMLYLLQADVPRKPHHYQYSDAAHASACVAIATAHPELALAAMERLLDLAENDTYDALMALNTADTLALLGAEQFNRVIGMPDVSSFLTDVERAGLKDRVRKLAADGRYPAAEILQKIAPESPEVRAAADAARDRILERPEPDSSHANSGIEVSADAALVRGLDTSDRDVCLRKLLAVADDNREVARNRRCALVGASVLVVTLPSSTRAEVYSWCAAFVDGEKDGSAHDDAFPNDASGMDHVDFGPKSMRGPGLFLALSSADNDDQYVWIRDQALDFLHSGKEDDLYLAAHVLNGLPASLTADIPVGQLAASASIFVRQVAAVLCSRDTTRNERLAVKLAHDPEVRVRRTLAGALFQAERSESTERIKEILELDPSHSVRARLRG